jgi:hypothetical protein
VASTNSSIAAIVREIVIYVVFCSLPVKEWDTISTYIRKHYTENVTASDDDEDKENAGPGGPNQKFGNVHDLFQVMDMTYYDYSKRRMMTGLMPHRP